MNDQLEISWLTDERPEPLPLDPAATARVREELLSHAAARRTRRRRPTRLRTRVLRVAVTGTALAGCATVGLLATGSSDSTSRTPHAGSHLGVQNAAAAELKHLTDKLATAPAPTTGDATLVLRTQTYPNQPSITGADLYADNGNYYYAATLAGLPSAIQSNDTVNTGGADDETRDIAAAKAALTGPIDQAREQMAVATYPRGYKPTELTPGSPAQAAALGKLPAVLRQKIEAIQQHNQAQHLQSLMSQANNMIWDNSMDALQAGASDPQVRAGVLKLLATIPQINVTQGTLAGQQTLVLTASLMQSDSGVYEETLILNASTGIPEQFIGGNAGQTPGVTVNYTINRVTVASIANGSYTG